MSIEEIREVFAALHDGSIVAHSGDKQQLRLTVSCLYLAERIDAAYEVFYLDLQDVAILQMKAWLADDATELQTDWETIFAGEPELATAEVADDTVIIWCNQDFATTGSYGGELCLRCAAVAVFDQQNMPLTLNSLKQLAAAYWHDWTLKN